MGVGGLIAKLRKANVVNLHKGPPHRPVGIGAPVGVDGNIFLWKFGLYVIRMSDPKVTPQEVLDSVLYEFQELASDLMMAGASSVSFVFDGLCPAAKKETYEAREPHLFRHSDARLVSDYLNSSIDDEGVSSSFAFFEADAELAEMAAQGDVGVIVTDDSDQVVACASRGRLTSDVKIWLNLRGNLRPERTAQESSKEYPLMHERLKVARVTRHFGSAQNLQDFTVAVGSDYGPGMPDTGVERAWESLQSGDLKQRLDAEEARLDLEYRKLSEEEKKELHVGNHIRAAKEAYESQRTFRAGDQATPEEEEAIRRLFEVPGYFQGCTLPPRANAEDLKRFMIKGSPLVIRSGGQLRAVTDVEVPLTPREQAALAAKFKESCEGLESFLAPVS